MLTCNVVKDLLPSYVDELVSKETAQEIAEHLADCAACNEEYEKMKIPLAPIAAQDEKDIDYLKKIKKTNRRRALKYSVVSVIAVSIIFVFCVQIFYIGKPVTSEDLLYTIYKPNAYSLHIEMELKNDYQLLVKPAYGEEVIISPRQVRGLPFDDVGNSYSWGFERSDGVIPDNFRVIIKFADKDVVLTIDDFQAGSSLDGTWGISNETLTETNTDNSAYQLISNSLTFSGESFTSARTIDMRTDYIVSMSDEELRTYYNGEVEIIERGNDYVIFNLTTKGTFSLTDDGTGFVIEGDEYIAPFSRMAKNIILLDGCKYVRKN